MKILTAEQMRLWDAFTIEHGKMSSIELMERAASECVQWICNHGYQNNKIHIFCGKGNNGGDGIAIGRILFSKGIPVKIFILDTGQTPSPDFTTNLKRLEENLFDVCTISSAEDFTNIETTDIIIDALFGTGLNKPPEGLAADFILHVNSLRSLIISIDIPSGLFTDHSSAGNKIIKATHTLSFQNYKMAFLIQENAAYFGQVHILNIELSQQYLQDIIVNHYFIDKTIINSIYKPRSEFAHKGNFGHVLIIGGSHGKIGAALLATKACLRSGAGLTTAYIPSCGYEILQTGAPEAMCITDPDFRILTTLPSYENFSTIGIGPGIGTEDETQKLVLQLIKICKKPLVLDADALNCLSKSPQDLESIPPYSILTPHPKEFDQLFGICINDFDRLSRAREKSKALKIIIILKSHHTAIVYPDGDVYFNSTGNSGMAKGGSGDVLTGILCALLAQKYSAKDAAILGIYLHGLSADLAIEATAKESLLASDLIEGLTLAYKAIRNFRYLTSI